MTTKTNNRINKVMDKFYGETDDMSLKDAIKLLKPILSNLKEIYPKYLEDESDHRSGYETYGYDNEESILGDLDYISDRWGSGFRIKWIIDLVENYEEIIKSIL